MKTFVCALMCFAFFVTAAGPQDKKTTGLPKPTVDLQPGIFRYQVKIEAGGQVMNLKSSTTIQGRGASWTAIYEMETPTGTVTDTTTIDKTTLIPRKRHLSQGPVVIDLNFSSDKATGKTSVNGQDRSIAVDLGGPLFADGAGADQAIANLPLAVGYSTTFRNFDFQTQKVKLMQLNVAGSESVTVPAGKFDAFRVDITSVDGGSDKKTVWVAKDTRKVVRASAVVAAMGGAVITMELLGDAATGLSAQENKTAEKTPTGPATSQAAGVVTGVKIAPDHGTLVLGESRQLTGTVEGTGSFSAGLKWSVNDVDGGNASLGTISSSGLYVTPYPTPAAVTIKATSTADPAKSAAAAITFAARPVVVGPALLVDAAAPTHTISPLIYGMNAYRLSDPWHEAPRVAKAVRLPLNRWGGDGVTLYNFKLDISNLGEDWFFEIAPKPNIRSLLVTAFLAIAVILYALAWWTVWKEKPSGRGWGIVASLIYLSVSLSGILLFARPLLGYEGILLALGAAGLFAFVDGAVRKQASGSFLERRPLTMNTFRKGLCWVFAITSLVSLGSDFQRIVLNGGHQDESEFNSQVIADRAAGARTMATMPVMGWIAKTRTRSGSFSVTKYGAQQKTDPYWGTYGNGVRPDGTMITNNDPTDTCMRIDASWDSDWVKYLVRRFGNAANGGVAIYALDNEPTWWDKMHRDVHPLPFTYDEVTQNGLKVAKAIKAADPTAEVSGPVIDFWLTYFYSKKDLPWLQPNWKGPSEGPVDRKAHGDLPLVDYYLRAFKAAQDADPQHRRFLDYLDLHTYFAANDAMLKPAGTSDRQKAVLDSTRAFWDPTYTEPQFRDPNNFLKPLAPQMIPRMKNWVAANYPGTRIAISEYNWGAPEHISGAVAQADILGIFGREGLDLGALWGPPNLNQPLMFAFKIFRNYDGAGAEFGDTSLAARSADQSKLSVYAARRTADHTITVVVINKTFGALRADLPIDHFKAEEPANVYQYSGADLTQIRTLPAVKTLSTGERVETSVVKDQLFPAMSITMYAIRGK